MINPVKKLEDIDYKILASHLKRVFIGLKVKNVKKNYYDEIKIRSILPNTTISIDVASEVRRTASIVFRGGQNSDAIKKLSIANAYSCEFELFEGYQAFIDKKWTEIRWYPQGLFVANQRSTTYDSATDTMTLSLSDKYCTLNGDRGGAITDKEVVIEAQKGTNISDVIFNAAGIYGNVKKFDIDAVGKEYTADGKILESMYNGISYEQLPYDLNYNETQAVSTIISDARDIRPGWQTYFDESGVFCVKRIPQYIDDPIEFAIKPEHVISENRTIDNNAIHNSLTLYGGNISTSVSYTKDNLDDSDRYKIDLGNYCDVFIHDIRATRQGGNYIYSMDITYSYKSGTVYYPVNGTVVFTCGNEDKYISLIDPDKKTLDSETGMMKPRVSVTDSKPDKGYLFKYRADTHDFIINDKDTWYHEHTGTSEQVIFSRSYKFDKSTMDTIVGSRDNYGYMGVGSMFAMDMPVEMLELQNRIPNNGLIKISQRYVVPNYHGAPCCYIRFTASGEADYFCRVMFKDLNGNYNESTIIDNYTKYDGVIGGYIYKVVKAERNEGISTFYVDYVCPIDTPKAVVKDLNPMSPYNVYDNEEYNVVLSGGEYEQIYTFREAYERAQYELWATTRINNSISLSCIDIPWLNVNKKVSYSLLSNMGEPEDKEKQYITQTIKRDISNGTMELTMTTFYPTYPDLSYNKTDKI